MERQIHLLDLLLNGPHGKVLVFHGAMQMLYGAHQKTRLSAFIEGVLMPEAEILSQNNAI